MQLIHMNGRMYDYNNGRFLSVDPFIQSPTSTQSMNPYTYIFNNPLSGVDPSGYLAKLPGDDIWKEILGPNNYRDPCARNICFGGKDDSDGSADKQNKNGDISDTGKQEGIFDGVIKPAAKNLGEDFVLGFSQLGQNFNKHVLAPPLNALGKLGQLTDDHQGALNTLQTLGPIGSELEMGIILSGKTFIQAGKLGSLLSGTRIAKSVDIAFDAVTTPYGDAFQALDSASLAARLEVSNGTALYRIGTGGKSKAANAQFWSLENPLSKGFAQRYGIPESNVINANFIEAGVIRSNTSFITRSAPGIGKNKGGGIEIVVPEGGVKLNSFNYGNKLYE